MKSEIGHIYLSWRKGQGQRRHIVGVIKKSATKGVTFAYDQKAVEKAKEEGFSPDVEFSDITKTYTDNVNAVTVDQIKTAFKKRVDLNEFSTVIVGVDER